MHLRYCRIVVFILSSLCLLACIILYWSVLLTLMFFSSYFYGCSASWAACVPFTFSFVIPFIFTALTFQFHIITYYVCIYVFICFVVCIPLLKHVGFRPHGLIKILIGAISTYFSFNPFHIFHFLSPNPVL